MIFSRVRFRMLFCQITLTIVIILCLATLALCEQLKKIELYSYDKTYFIIGGIDSSLVIATGSTSSLLGCSFLCANLNSDSFYFIENSEQNCRCNSKVDIKAVFSENNTGVVYGYTDKGLKISRNSTFVERYDWPIRRDCLDLYQIGYTDDGVYRIRSTEITWCDMTNGGWTVIQRRQDGSENFYRPWNDYVNGFGNRTGEYWIGLENIYHLTLQNSRLRIEMETFGDVTPLHAYAEYTIFKVDSSITKYRLTIGGFTGDCGDSLGSFHNGRVFATYDRDSAGCALQYKGAWWYSGCHYSNLNGLYLPGNHSTIGIGMNWAQCWGHFYSVKSSVMKVKRIAP